MEKQSIIFGYYVNGTLKGFRKDTFGNLSMNHPKIYIYSKEQIDAIKENVKIELSWGGSSFIKSLSNDVQLVNYEGNPVDVSGTIDNLHSSEEEKRNWGEFELRVIPFISKEDTFTYPEQWKIDAALASLENPLEIHKFMVPKDEN